MVCRRALPEKRFRRRSPYCSGECRATYRKARRDWQATKHCRLCGRPARKLQEAAAGGRKGKGAGRSRSSKVGLLLRGHRAR